MFGIVLERFVSTGALWADDTWTGVGVGGAETEVGGASVDFCWAAVVAIMLSTSSPAPHASLPAGGGAEVPPPAVT